MPVRVIEVPQQELLLDGGVGYGRELRFEAPRQTDALATLGARYRLALSATSELTNEAGYRVAFGDAGNWRGSHLIALTAALNSFFSLRLSHDLWYVHEPVPGFGTTDRITSAALVATFSCPAFRILIQHPQSHRRPNILHPPSPIPAIRPPARRAASSWDPRGSWGCR